MADANIIGLGIIFAVVGLLFFAAARLLVRSAPGMLPQVGPGPRRPAGNLKETNDAVLLIESGGRIHTLNGPAREVFHLAEGEEPDLDRLSRRARPLEAFLELCAGEGQAHLTIEGRLAEAASYRVDLPEPLILVSLHFPEIGAGLNQATGLSTSTLQRFTELNLAMASSLDLERTIQAILENVEKLIPADVLEMTVWDNETQDLVPCKLLGLAASDRALEKGAHRTAGEGLSGYLYRERQPLYLADIQQRADLIRAGDGRLAGMRSFLGMPLQAGKEFVGTLELASRSSEAFHDDDLNIIRLLSGQAAIALHNAMVYEQEQRRSQELSGLAQLGQALSSVRDIKGLFERLVKTIAPLFEVEILGFLIYNESQRVLEGQAPFVGLPDPFVELYRTAILPGSAAEKTLLDQDVLITENAAEDPQWEVLGLDHLAQAASLRDTVLIPLNSGGHVLGYLQASNHSHGGGFAQSELHLLSIIANQAAAMIENALLMQQSRQRVQRADTLRQIISMASTAANLDEILAFAVQEISRLLKADNGAIFLLDQSRTVLQLNRAALVGALEALPERTRRLLVDDPQFPFTVTDSQKALHFGQADGQKAIIPFYQSVLAAWKIESLIAVPLVVRNEGIGEVWIGSQQPAFFDMADVQLVATAGGQLAAAVEQVFLRTQTDEALRRRLDRLVAVSRISRELNNTLDLNALIRLIHSEALRATGATCGSVLFFDLSLSVQQEPQVRMWHGDLHEPGLTEEEQKAVELASALRVASFQAENRLPPHAGVESELIVPILFQQRVAGLILLHGEKEGQFSDTDQDICQSLAVQAAVALGNAVQYEDQSRRSALLSRELDTLAELLQISRMLRPTLPLEESLTAIGGAVRQATPFQVNVISVCDPESMVVRRVCSSGLSPDQWAELQNRTEPWASIERLLLPEFRFGNVYFIPGDKTPLLPAEVYTITVAARTGGRPAEGWDPDDFLLVPLYDSNNRPLGLISLDAPSDGRRPDRPTFEALEIFGVQAALMIENHRRTSDLEKRVTEMEIERERLKQSTHSAAENLPVLLRKDLEQTVALQSLNRQAERMRASLEIAALATVQPERAWILETMARELLTRFAMQTALIAERTPAGMQLLQVVGSAPSQANPEALFGQRNPLRWLLQEGGKKESEVFLLANVENSPEWQGNPLLAALEARSAVGLMLNGGGEQRYGVLLTGRRSLAAFSEEDRRIFTQLASQVGIGLQNLQLLTETQQRLNEVNLLLEFSLKLGSLEPENILSTLVESIRRVLPSAQAAWAGLLEDGKAGLQPQAAAGYTDLEALRLVAFQAEQDPAGEAPLPLRVFQNGTPQRSDDVNFAAQYRLSADALMNYRKATQGRLPVSCLALPLRLGEVARGVLMLENFDLAHAFSAEDEALAYSFAQQASLGLDNARLYQSTHQRAAQMQSLTRVSSRLTSNLKQVDLIDSLLDLLGTVIPFETATLWIKQNGALTVRAARGFEESAGLIGISVAEKDSVLFRDMVAQGGPVVVADVRRDERFPNLVEPQNLAWMGLPLVVKGETVGMIAVEKREGGYYRGEHAQVAATFTSQAAVALENARLFEESTSRSEELNERSQRLALLNRLSGELGGTLDIDEILDMTAQRLREALDAAGAAAVMVGPGGKFILQREVPARLLPLPQALLEAPLLERLSETRGLFVTADARSENDLGALQEVYCGPCGVQALLVVPLLSGTALHGWLLLDKAEVYRFSLAEIELARTVCNQAATAIQNARLFDETRSLSEFLERRVEERTGELRREHQNSQMLLRIISELSNSLDMDLVMNRALNVVNESFGSQESMVILAQGSGRIYRAGAEPAGKSPAANQLPREIARVVGKTRKTFSTADIGEEAEFAAARNGSQAARSVLAVPLMMGEDALGVLLISHGDRNYFREEQAALAEATARQLGIAINNAELFNLIRDQSENLGKMLREQQIEASRSRAILEAVADGVVVTDDQGRVNLFNQSAERILGLNAKEAAGQALDQFSGLFGRSGTAWLHTIRNWISAAGAYQGEAFADRFELDSGRVVAVNLAPVFFRTQLLGTVSIIRDITHEVQVDRLKSEFVANVSHELRTPMTSIKGYVEIMLMGAAGELSGQQRHFLEIVKSNTDRLSGLVSDLLDVSRIESGRMRLRMRALDLPALAGQVVEDLRRRSEEEGKRMNFALEIPADLPVAAGDEERIRQVLGNLVGNGYCYTPANGHVTVRMAQAGDEVQVDVVDTGIGIDPEDQPRIFERFYRGEDALILATAGTGLGLAIARNLVEMHNGRIWFSSSGRRGEGSTFSFTLPVSHQEE